MRIDSIPGFRTQEERQTSANYAKKIGAPTLLAGASAFIASKAPKGADTVKLSKRISKAGAAGLVTALVMTALTLADKEKVSSAANKIKGIFTKNKNEESAQLPAQEPVNAQAAQVDEALNEALAVAGAPKAPAEAEVPAEIQASVQEPVSAPVAEDLTAPVEEPATELPAQVQTEEPAEVPTEEPTDVAGAEESFKGTPECGEEETANQEPAQAPLNAEAPSGDLPEYIQTPPQLLNSETAEAPAPEVPQA